MNLTEVNSRIQMCCLHTSLSGIVPVTRRVSTNVHKGSEIQQYVLSAPRLVLSSAEQEVRSSFTFLLAASEQ